MGILYEGGWRAGIEGKRRELSVEHERIYEHEHEYERIYEHEHEHEMG